ncbi:putative permease, DMT superfamily [Halobacteroides halobius DSM 5150]|uniref:Putative permease, DMT superfamily n=1 Tax=Halobacteroides halobius (strain ATCC 35273 / DSM 5150 / MD-1) TaxID=748449 RepID=L0K5D5_HALHC|nr:DMT family transporter [Halobacteroides halobius]AGB40487.1 putative permease, DMT superfamily [Halobacteroides halobius DSM 5150]
MIKRRLKADLALLMVVLIWGSTFAIMKGIFNTITPVYFLTLRFGVATLILVIIFHKRLSSLDFATLKAGLVAGLFLFGGYAFQVTGLELTTASSAGFITGLSVVLVPLFSALFFRKVPPFMTWLGVILATLGLGLLSFEGQLLFNLGDFLVLLCACSLALHILLVDRYVQEKDAVLLAIVQIATVALLSSMWVGFKGSYQSVSSFEVWSSIIYMGALATAVAFLIQNKAQTFTTPTRTAIIFSLEPIFGALFAYLYLGEVISLQGYLGGSLIVLGMLLAEVKFKKIKEVVGMEGLK